jgi:hypothetical protein
MHFIFKIIGHVEEEKKRKDEERIVKGREVGVFR